MALWVIAICLAVHVVSCMVANFMDLFNRTRVAKEALQKFDKMTDEQVKSSQKMVDDEKHREAMKRVDRLNRTSEMYKLMGMQDEYLKCIEETTKILDEALGYEH